MRTLRFIVLAAAAGCAESPTSSRLVPSSDHATLASAASPVTIYGPKRFTRAPGAPQVATITIATDRFEAPFSLHVRNGSAGGGDRVSSARITLDGTEVFGPADFSQESAAVSALVSPSARAELRVTLAGAPGAFLEVWLEGTPRGTRVCPDGSGDFATIAEAVGKSEDGATLLLCAGTHRASDILLGGKSLTIAAEGPKSPTVDAGLAGTAFSISKPSASTITIRGLRFVRASRAAIAVDDQAGAVLITDNTFIDGIDAIRVNRSAGTEIRSNSFDGQSFSSTQVRQSRNVRVAENAYTNCGPDYCIVFHDSPGAQIIGNRLTIPFSRRTDNPITVSAWPSALDATITDNVIIGVGNGSGGRFDPSSYPIHVSGIQVAVGSATISRNRITNARGGINVTPAAFASGSDNVITTVLAPFLAGGAARLSTVSFVRNDISDYMVPVEWDGFASADLRCNWWGSASGPSGIGGLSPGTDVAPWATEPIAGRPSIVCL